MARPPAPHIAHPYIFSVSQIENFILCNRKWAFNKIDKIREPETESQKLGLRVHDVLESYLKHAVSIDPDTLEGSIAMSGHQFLPLPKSPGLRVEEWFSVQFGVAAYRGLKDIEIIRPGEIPQVKDHKTTKSFGWQKQSKQLAEDIQAGLYAADAMHKTGSSTVDLEWIYYRTTGARKAQTTRVTLTESQVQATCQRIDETAQRMIHVLKTVNNGMEAEPNYSSCSAFGGCPHRTVRCKISSKAVLASIMRQKMSESKRMKDTSDFLKDLAKRKKKKGKKKNGKLDFKKPKIKDEEKDEPQINSNEREGDLSIPDPPDPKKIHGNLYQAYFDEDRWEWVWPEEVEELEKKKKKGKKKRAPEETFDVRKGKKKKKKAEAAEPLDTSEDIGKVFEALVDIIASRVVESLRKD